MFATAGIIKDNQIQASHAMLEQYNSRKVIITILDDTAAVLPDDKIFEVSDALIAQNMEAYRELAK